MESRGEVELAPIPERKTSGTAYDTAWTARITDENGTPTFPECIKWFSSMVSASIMYTCVWNRCSGSSVCWVNFPETLIGPVIP